MHLDHRMCSVDFYTIGPFLLSYDAICSIDNVLSLITFKGLFLSSMPRPLTLLPIQKYKETAEAFREQLTSYCVQICSTCIFQDAESHHWADPQPFYEVKGPHISQTCVWFKCISLQRQLKKKT